MAGGFAGSANSAPERPIFTSLQCTDVTPLYALSCACWQEKNGLLEAPEAKSFQFLCRTPPSVARWLALTPQTQCSETSGWCRSSDCARLPNARGSGNIGLAHALSRDLHTVPESLCHTVSTRAQHLANASTSHVARPCARRRRPAAAWPPRCQSRRPRAHVPSRAPTVPSCGASARPPRLNSAAWPLFVGTLLAWHAAPRARPAHCCCALWPLMPTVTATAPAHKHTLQREQGTRAGRPRTHGRRRARGTLRRPAGMRMESL